MAGQIIDTVRPRLEQSIHDANTWVLSSCRHAYETLDKSMKSKKLDQKLQRFNTTLKTANIDPEHLFYGFFALITITWALRIATHRLRLTHQAPRPSTPDLEKRSPLKAPPRKPGSKHTIHPLSLPLL